MKYQSTRGRCGTCSGSEALLLGLAPDGGLFLPENGAIPKLPVDTVLTCSEEELAARILALYFPEFTEKELSEMVSRAYGGRFSCGRELTPVKKVGPYRVLELYHGPTSAFKDVALCMLPELICAAKKHNGVDTATVILTATSGDTGKAALEGFHDVPGTKIIVFYPENGVSAVQKAQMVTQSGSNVSVCAVRGNFDDAQSGVKDVFSRVKTEEDNCRSELSSANSINIGRLVPQIVYYYHAYLELLRDGSIRCGELVDFTVPTGNFGDILAGYLAMQMGLPVGRLVCASNRNDVLTEFFETGIYDRNREFYKTASPSMDILISSNLERLLYLESRDAFLVSNLMEELKQKGSYSVPEGLMDRLREVFAAGSCSEEDTLAEIGNVFRDLGYLMDTHTAVAWHVARSNASPERPMVVLSTASPFKFPAAVLKALGRKVPEDEFDAIGYLSEISGVTAPEALASLKTKPVLHHDVIDRQEMLSYVRNRM